MRFSFVGSIVGEKMARELGRLSALKVSRVREPGMYPDGGGLYLQVSATGAKSWIFRYMILGRPRAMGLGALNAVSLAGARQQATECRALRAKGIDPIDARKAQLDSARLAAAKDRTFRACAEAYIADHRSSWRNAKHAQQWENTLKTYAYPVIRDTSVQAVDTELVMKILKPIWSEKPETASRLRGRIETVLDWAKAHGYRQGENPARWRGHIANLLPKKSKVRRVRHHPAMAYSAVPDFFVELRDQDGTAAEALEFLILTMARTSEVIGLRWPEIDMERALWTVPADRIKGGKEHRVPLSDRAVAILRRRAELRPADAQADGFVFPGGKKDKGLSNAAMSALLKRMDLEDITVHGFRSSFRDWAAECTHFPNEVCEMALAHVVDDKVEAAYRRGDMFEKRRELAKAWAALCGSAKNPGGQVVQLRREAEAPAPGNSEEMLHAATVN